MKILFYGNCQIEVICKTLNLKPKKYETCVIKCYQDNVTQQAFTDRLKTTDIVITQSIKDDYRGKEYLSTNYILRNCNPNCKVIILPSYRFTLYHFDVFYNDKINGPCDNHYTNMIECYKKGKSVDYYLENYVNNPHFKTKEELEKILEDNLNDTDNKHVDLQKYKLLNENVITLLPISKFIRANYKDTLLFHTIKHPTKALFHHVCHEILNVLHIENTMDYWPDHLSSNIRNIMYKCVEQVINFKQSVPLIDFNNVFHHDSKSVTQFYYNGYKQLDQSCFD